MSGLEDVLAEALRAEGLTDKPTEHDGNIHSWRCCHPDIYGPCSCFREAVTDIATAIRDHLLSDEVVERAAVAHYGSTLGVTLGMESDEFRADRLNDMRAALRAATETQA